MRAAPTILTMMLALLLAPSAAFAQAPESMPPPGSVWTVFNTVTADVRDNYATVKVIADIRNQGPDPEFPFIVRVPDDAFVTGLTIERDGIVYEAQVKDWAVAREEYEDWKSQQQTGGLVEKARHTSVYSYLINVAEFTNVRATLTYERYLAADRGVYNMSLEAPVSGFGRDLGARFDVTVRDSDGVLGLWGDPRGQTSGNTIVYEVGPRPDTEHPTPFTASYMLASTAEAGSLLTTIIDGTGYFAHRFRAQDDAQQLPMDLVLVLDVSGSMAGLKLQQMIDAAKQVVAGLDAEDRLHLVAFSSDSHSTWSGLLEMTPANRKRAAEEIDALFDGGGTNIEAGLVRGFAALDGVDWTREEGRFAALVLLTDGQPTAGTTTRDGLRAIAKEANDHRVPVFGIAFGDDADWGLIRALAEDGEGAAVRVPLGAGAEVDLRRFMAALTTPVLRDVRIEYSDGVRAYRTGAPVLFAGSELLVVGTFDPARGISGTVTGISPTGERRYTFEGGEAAALSFLPRLVAYQRVRDMQQDDVPDAAAIKELALRYSFVTDQTSLVLTLPARDWREAPVTDDRRVAAEDSSWSGAPSGATTNANTNTASRSSQNADIDPSGGTWLPMQTKQQGSPEPSHAYDADGFDAGPPAPTAPPGAAVPGPAIALLVLALAIIALLARRR